MPQHVAQRPYTAGRTIRVAGKDIDQGFSRDYGRTVEDMKRRGGYRPNSGRKTVDPYRRFEAMYEAIPEAGCWIWLGSLSSGLRPEHQVYGKFSIDGKTMQANRASWVLFRGQIPEGMFVCHRCDVRSCVNPDHLFLGTQKQNLEDMVRKGRSPRPQGEKSGHAKITNEAVLEMRLLRRQGKKIKELADKFGVGPSHVSNIVRGMRWSHI